MSGSRALVTGATGGLGLALCAALMNAGYEVRATGRKLEAKARLEAIGAEVILGDLLHMSLANICAEMDVVFHAAALSSPWGPRAEFHRINVDATAALLTAARQAGAKGLVFVSSPSIYATMKDQEGLSETSPLPEKSLNAYAATKRIAEQLVLAADAPGFRTTSIRPRALIGPDDTVLLPRILALVSRGWFPLFRGGRALVELTDVRDAATALVRAAQNLDKAGGKAINISGGRPTAVIDLARNLGDVLSRDLKLRPVPMPLARALAQTMEGVCSLLPDRPEPKLTTYGIATLAYTQTFDLSRARDLLDYSPKHDALATTRTIAAQWAAR